MCHPDERAALAEVEPGLVDVFRQLNPDPGQYTWWDYRQLSFPKNRGLRIDHILCTPGLAPRCRSVAIDRDARKGQIPSDHAPVVENFLICDEARPRKAGNGNGASVGSGRSALAG